MPDPSASFPKRKLTPEARRLRVVLSPRDVLELAELREKLQKAQPAKSVTDSDVVRYAVKFANEGTT